MQNYLWFDQINLAALADVGGKNASIGEMISNLSKMGVKVPYGFATCTEAFHDFLVNNGLDKEIEVILDKCNTDNVSDLQNAGSKIRNKILSAEFTKEFTDDIAKAYGELVEKCREGATFAVRSSATAEDLPTASFAGQQETFLNISGLDNILSKIKKVYASLFNDRAISYRVHHGFKHIETGISVGIQQMIRSDLSVGGVMFTIDTESGYEGAIYITSSYGLGEAVVGGLVNPDEFYVDKYILGKGKYPIIRKNKGTKKIKVVYTDEDGVKSVDVPKSEQNNFSLTDKDIQELASLALTIESHYGMPMDIEWAKDGLTNELYILQARPETVESNKSKNLKIEKYILKSKGDLLISGRSVGSKIGYGKVKILTSLDDMNLFQLGDVLVADMTDPDWEPIMKKASAIITNRGGRTCHAAIIARELGIPAVVGTENATQILKQDQLVTVSCAEGDGGKIYADKLDYVISSHELSNLPKVPVNIMLNVGNPDNAFNCHNLPIGGVGLARLEFIINNNIGIHPNAILNISELSDELRGEIHTRCAGYSSPRDFYQQKLIEGISTIASVFRTKPVIVRMSDFKSNEYANLIGGDQFEPNEENPMIGFRGAARYVAPSFKECFEIECKAIKFVREEMGLDNIQVMIPFVRTVSEAEEVLELMKNFGIEKGKNGLKVIMMCEVPSNVILADTFLQHFDGFSIGSNDLTQLTLGLDRDSSKVAYLFDERNLAIKNMLEMAIASCKKANKYIGICGQAPSDYIELAKWLTQQGIESISLNPDSVVSTIMELAETNKE
jgi:pyruvate,water dikinase